MSYCDGRHPGLKKYREARAKGKEKAILRKEIVKNNPDLANKPKQLEAIVEGALRAKQSRTIEVKGRNRKGRKGQTRKVVVTKA